MKDKKVLLTIAGSDTSGGAGLQADLKTAIRLGFYPCSVISVITAQNSIEFSGCWPVAVDILEAQLEAVFHDFVPDAVKIGLLASAEQVLCVSLLLKRYSAQNVVVDPVLSPTLKDGEPDLDLCREMVRELFPLSRLVTPNIPEKEWFEKATGESFDTLCEAFLLKGGHSGNQQITDTLFYYSSDLNENASLPSSAFPTINFNHSSLFNHGNLVPEAVSEEPILLNREYRHKKLSTSNLHGTGCILSTAIACYLGMDYSLEKAVEKGLDFTQNALQSSSQFRFWKGEYGPSLI